jgi:hypothetical protein
VCNHIRSENLLPRDQREATIIPFLKHRRNRSLAASYRFISLTICACKPMETLQAVYLTGFRKVDTSYSTIDEDSTLQTHYSPPCQRREQIQNYFLMSSPLQLSSSTRRWLLTTYFGSASQGTYTVGCSMRRDTVDPLKSVFGNLDRDSKDCTSLFQDRIQWRLLCYLY